MKLKKFKTLDGFERGGALLRASRSGKVLVACDVACRAWDTRTWKVIGEIEDVEEDDGPVGACDLTPDGSLLAVGEQYVTTKVFDTRTGKCVARLSKPKKEIHTAADHVAFSPDGRELACANHKALRVYRVKDWQPAREYPGHPPQIAGMAYTPDGKTLATSGGKSVIFWGTADAKKKLELIGHKKLVHGPAIAEDGSFVATPSEDGVVKLWKLPSGKQYGQYTGHEDMVFQVLLSSDGRTAASYDLNEEFHLWDTASQEHIGTVKEGDYERTEFSPDGRFLVIPAGAGGFPPSLRLVDARSGKVSAEIKGAEGVAFVGRLMAVSQGAKVVLYELGK